MTELAAGPEGAKPPAHLLSRRRIVFYYAQCTGCGWDESASPKTARVHSEVEHHTVKETRHSLVEPK